MSGNTLAALRIIEPRYVPDVCLAPAVDDAFVVSNSATFDPNLDSNCNGGLIQQPGAPEICVVHYRTIRVDPSVTLTIVGKPDGTPGRSIALVADGDVLIHGTLDVSAHGASNGPGGGA